VLDTAAPHLARAYDYLLGGEASFAADRALAARLIALYPGASDVLLSSRTYAADTLTHIARQGVDQYLDVGSGLPTRPSTHGVVRALLPGAKVVYVDRDPVVTAHGAALVPAGVRYLAGDLAEPEAILADTAAFLDLRRPVCLVLGLVLQALDPGTARAVAGVLVRALPAGSFLVATVGAGDEGRLPDAVWPAVFTPAELESFFGGLELLPPGISPGAALGGTGYKEARRG
jgi:S-adenosyl methyltransferase